MTVTLSNEEIEALLTCIQYSKREVSETQGTPSSVRHETLSRLDSIENKLREARKRSS